MKLRKKKMYKKFIEPIWFWLKKVLRKIKEKIQAAYHWIVAKFNK